MLCFQWARSVKLTYIIKRKTEKLMIIESEMKASFCVYLEDRGKSCLYVQQVVSQFRAAPVSSFILHYLWLKMSLLLNWIRSVFAWHGLRLKSTHTFCTSTFVIGYVSKNCFFFLNMIFVNFEHSPLLMLLLLPLLNSKLNVSVSIQLVTKCFPVFTP